MSSSAVRYIRLEETGPLPTLDDFRPFRAVVVIDTQVSVARQSDISAWLVSSGCLYMMAWGIDCSSWDDSVDMANIEQFDFGDVPDDRFVMTSWHENEELPEVLWFAKHAARHPQVEIANVLLLHISDMDGELVLRDGYDVAT